MSSRRPALCVNSTVVVMRELVFDSYWENAFRRQAMEFGKRSSKFEVPVALPSRSSLVAAYSPPFELWRTIREPLRTVEKQP